MSSNVQGKDREHSLKIVAWTFSACLASYLLLFVVYYPRGLESGDNAYKIQQIQDLRESGRTDVLYGLKEVDPRHEFYPAIYPFLIESDGSYHLPFPFQLIHLYRPFYALGGLAGIVALVLSTGIGVLILGYKIIARQAEPSRGAPLLMVLAGGSALIPYAFSAYEHVITTFCFLAAAYFYLFSRFPYREILAGLSVGLGLFVRAESILLAPLLLAGRFLASGGKFRLQSDLRFALTTGILFLLFVGSNLLLTGHPFGFRGKAGFGWPVIADALYRVLEYLWLREQPYTTLGRATPAVALSLLLLLQWQKAGEEYRTLFLSGWAYCLAVPFLISVPPAAQFGERYIMAAYPLLILSMLPLTRSNVRWQRYGLLLLFIGTTAWTVRGGLEHLKNARKFREGLALIAKEAWAATGSEKVVVLRNRTLNTFYFHDPEKRTYLLAESDADFHRLIALLRTAGISRISVWHTLLRGENLVSPQGDTFSFAPTLVPKDFKGRQISSRAVPFLEIANYEIGPIP
ncbi:MAG: hypothetical protein HS115_19835 [Spirochaetales bacterium]|nr:hypothetical protein [Spirochaetales bacterium]